MAKKGETADNTKAEAKSQNAVLYVSRLPYGFDETAAWQFFGQFGALKGVCYPRSAKSGRSKGYLFLLFDDRDVATECGRAMHNYYMFGKQVRTHVLPESHKIVHDRFRAQPTKFKFVPWTQIHKKSFGSNTSDEHRLKKMRALLENDDRKVAKLKELGIKYEFPTYRDLINN